MKLIFIDIDGVLNSSTGSGPYLADMEISKITLLKRVIDTTNSDGIVLISDRRYSSVYMKQFESAMDEYEIYIVGQLRNPNEDDYDDNRGKQILDYLDSSDNNIERIVILDDNDDGISTYFPEEFIKVNRFFGLNEEVVKKIEEILL